LCLTNKNIAPKISITQKFDYHFRKGKVMKRIYIFIFLTVWMFAACSSNTGTVKTDAPATDTPVEAQATPQAGTPATAPMETKASEVFHHTGAGFSVTKPADWKYLSPEMVKTASETTKWNDAELEKAIKANPNSPLVVLTRYQEPYPTLNPSVSVTMVNLPVEGMPPKDILNMSTEVLKRAYPDLTYVDEVQDTNVDGINGAYTKIKYTMAAGDQKFPTTTRMWLVPRGKIMFTVGMSGPQEGPDASEETFKGILNSIKIEKK
jgi:hypothetical protein